MSSIASEPLHKTEEGLAAAEEYKKAMSSLANVYCETCSLSDIKEITEEYKEEYNLVDKTHYWATKDCEDCQWIRMITGKEKNEIFVNEEGHDRYIGEIPEVFDGFT